MKRLLAMAVPLFAAMATSASAEALWTGEGIIKAVSAGCGTTWQVGDFGTSVFRPVVPGSSINGNKSRLVFTGNNTVISHEVSGAFTGDVAYQGAVISPSGILTTYTPAGGIKNAGVTPATFTGHTANLRVRGRISRFGNIAGCTVSFDGVYVKKS